MLKSRPFPLPDKIRALLTDEAAERLRRLRIRLESLEDWTPPPLDQLLKGFAAEEQVGMGQIGPLLRGVLSGGAPAPDLAGTLFALRRDEALARIDDALSRPA